MNHQTGSGHVRLCGTVRPLLPSSVGLRCLLPCRDCYSDGYRLLNEMIDGIDCKERPARPSSFTMDGLPSSLPRPPDAAGIMNYSTLLVVECRIRKQLFAIENNNFLNPDEV